MNSWKKKEDFSLVVKEGWRDKEMNISKNAVKKKIFTFRTLTKKKNEKKMFLSQNVHWNICLKLYPFCSSFMNKKKEMKGMEISRTEKE